MNAHIPQSYESMVELEEIAAIPHHIITPRHAKPMIGVYQDTLVGTYRLTQPNVQFTLKEFMNLMMWNKRFDGVMPAPRAGQRYTGQQVLGALLPPINMEMANKSFNKETDRKDTSENYVQIIQGQVERGVVDGKIYMEPSKGIIHMTYNDHGAKETVDLLDALQNTVEHFLVMNGFSVGISDLISDEKTKEDIDAQIQERKKAVEQLILQVHLDLFDNNTGKTNQEEFEDQIFGILNKATADAGDLGQKSLSKENRLLAMVRSGSKGEPLNVAQMMACLGQTAIEAKRIPYGFTDRTLPHYKKYDDSAESRGFIESSFIRGLTPQQFFFHAMSGREGLIDTAVKSVTGDTEILIQEEGAMKWTTIGEWIDGLLAAAPSEIEHHETANMELLHLRKEVRIPTCDEKGVVSWGQLTAVTRHDPGECLYRVKTLGGRSVTVAKSQSLIVWDEKVAEFVPKPTPDVKVGEFLPTTTTLPSLPTEVEYVKMERFFPKKEYIYGTDFNVAKEEMTKAMSGRFHIPRGWWDKNNGSMFTLPYPSKARFQRTVSGRSKIDHIVSGYIYPYHAERTEVRIPERFVLNQKNGVFIGLFLADGNADIPSGYVQITKNNIAVRTFVKEWFEEMGIQYTENVREVTIPTTDGSTTTGVSSDVRGFSRLLGQFLTSWVGHGSSNKYVPTEAFAAPREFVIGLLNGYFSGDGHIAQNGLEATSVSSRLIHGISQLCNRLGIFCQLRTAQLEQNNVGSKNIAQTHIMSIRSKWARIFADTIQLVNDEKQQKLNTIRTTAEHINYESHNDVVLDRIVEISRVDSIHHPKLYDVTVPSTLNFGLANGLMVRDTAD